MESCNLLLFNATVIDCQGIAHVAQAVAIKNDRILWVGDLDKFPDDVAVQERFNCQGQLLTPGLIDCHTHLVYAGQRANEFELKLRGASYTEIAQAGGGIFSTVKATRAASEEELFNASLPRILALKAEGVTTVEIKSGYGLDRENEIKMLKVAQKLAAISGVRVFKTFLGAHTVPPEYRAKPQAYVDLLCDELLPELLSLELVDAVDVFCESIAFDLKQTEQIFAAAQRYNLPVKCHAEQLSNIGASKLAAAYHALSCEHLEYLDEESVIALAQSGTIAVLLPGAYYFLREQQQPPIQLLRKHGVNMAVATDCNPGSSPTTSLLLMMSMATQFFGLSVLEALMAVTINAAKALGLAGEQGEIAPGKRADLVLWAEADSRTLCYYFAYPLPHKTMIAGKWL